MNHNYRFAKYYPVGSVFAKHIDRPTVHEHEKCSIYTVNIYLNDLTAEQVNNQPHIPIALTALTFVLGRTDTLLEKRAWAGQAR